MNQALTALNVFCDLQRRRILLSDYRVSTPVATEPVKSSTRCVSCGLRLSWGRCTNSVCGMRGRQRQVQRANRADRREQIAQRLWR